MASIKQRKSKNRHELYVVLRDEQGREFSARDIDYAYRKRAFASLPPAKILKPVRVLKLAAQRALAAWESHQDAYYILSYPYDQVSQWTVARRSQGAGYATRAVQAWAAAA